jgi:hypothetical protein
MYTFFIPDKFESLLLVPLVPKRMAALPLDFLLDDTSKFLQIGLDIIFKLQTSFLVLIDFLVLMVHLKYRNRYHIKHIDFSLVDGNQEVIQFLVDE